MNQAVGRCVRHAKDWGAVLLADSRFADAGRRKNLPAWLRHEIRQPAPFRDVAAHLRSFINEHHGRKPAPKASEKTSTAFGLRSSSRASAPVVKQSEDAFDALGKLQKQVRKAPASVQDPRVSAFLAKRTKVEQPPAKTLRREAPLVERKPSLPSRKALPVVKRAPVAFPATSSTTRVKDTVAAFPSRKQESAAAQLMRESEPLRDPDISDADASTAIKRLARIPASLDALRESKAGRRLATYVRRVECPAAERLLERWKALATPADDDGYEDVASAEAGARAEERARRHLDDYLGRAPVPAAPAPPPKPSRPPPAGVGTSKRARMLLSYTNT